MELFILYLVVIEIGTGNCFLFLQIQLQSHIAVFFYICKFSSCWLDFPFHLGVITLKKILWTKFKVSTILSEETFRLKISVTPCIMRFEISTLQFAGERVYVDVSPM